MTEFAARYEERQPLVQLRALAASGAAGGDARQAFGPVAARLKAFAPALHAAIESYVASPSAPGDVIARIDAFLADPPAGYCPPEKLTRTLDRVRAQNVEGVVVFSTSGLAAAKLWEALAEFFGK